MAELTRTLGRTGATSRSSATAPWSCAAAARPEICAEEAGRLLNGVLDSGINLIDTSPDYGHSEELIGSHLGHRRDEFFLATKCGCPSSPGRRAAVRPRTTTRREHPRRRRAEPAPHAHGPPRPRPVPLSPSQAGWRRTAGRGAAGAAEEGKVRFIGMSGTLPQPRRPDRDGGLRRVPDPVFGAAARARGADRSRRRRPAPARSSAAAWRAAPRPRTRPGAPSRSLRAPAAASDWESAGLDEILPAGMNRMEFTLRFTLSHPGLSTAIVGTANPDHCSRTSMPRGEGPAPRGPLRRGEEAAPAAVTPPPAAPGAQAPADIVLRDKTSCETWAVIPA